MDQEILVSFYTEFLPLRGRKSSKTLTPPAQPTTHHPQTHPQLREREEVVKSDCLSNA